MIKKIGLLTSGGDAQGMNACIRSVVRTCLYNNVTPFGIYRGYDGLINNKIEPLESRSVGNILQRGGTILKCARSTEFRTDEGRAKAYKNFIKNKLDALIVIGGDGSITGADLFSREYNVPVIGIPATIDNDIFGTDFTIGFDTASNIALDAIDKIRDTADSHNRIFFIEIMGKNAGYLALQVGLASGAEIILVPEVPTTDEEIFKELKKSTSTDKTSHIVIVAEGFKGGNAYEIAEKVNSKFTKYDCKVAVLGHIQRGGSPTCNDRILASQYGIQAVKLLLLGKSNLYLGKISGQIITQPIEHIKTKKEKLDQNLIEVKDILTKI